MPETLSPSTTRIRFGLPKGRIEKNALSLLAEAGIGVTPSARGYRPEISLAGFEAKTLKPQNIVEMLDQGRRDVGFAGADWVAELDAELVELVDTGLDPVRVVAAGPREWIEADALPGRRLLVVSEYQRLAARWIAARGLDADLTRSYGATEVFPPEDADLIVDNTATGSTLRANGLAIAAELMRSTTRLYASPRALEDAGKRSAIEDLALLLRSVLDARRRVMIELNAPADRLEAIVALLPAMRQPTVSELYEGAGYAVRAAIPAADLPHIVPAVKAAGGSDVVVSRPSQIVP